MNKGNFCLTKVCNEGMKNIHREHKGPDVWTGLLMSLFLLTLFCRLDRSCSEPAEGGFACHSKMLILSLLLQNVRLCVCKAARD